MVFVYSFFVILFMWILQTIIQILLMYIILDKKTNVKSSSFWISFFSNFLLLYFLFLLDNFFYSIIILLTITLIFDRFVWTYEDSINISESLLIFNYLSLEDKLIFFLPKSIALKLYKIIVKIQQKILDIHFFLILFVEDINRLLNKIKTTWLYKIIFNNFFFLFNLFFFNKNKSKKTSYITKTRFSSFFKLKFKLNKFFNDKFFFKNIISFYNFLKTIVLSLILSAIYFIYSIFFFKIQFLKQISVWFIIGILFFWLISGFNFFIKRYQYGKFTSQIQRFWKRTNNCFWLIEGFLLLLFFYYYLNSSQEPAYMYDFSSLNQEYLISLYTISFNTIILALIIYIMYFTLLKINSNSWEQLNLLLLFISIFIFFCFFIESYQFYYVISSFNERFWTFNEEENLWTIETDNPIFRTKSQYFLVCLIAKYWHFLFIFLSWVFFLMKSFEKKKISYTLFSSNLQNIILLFGLNFACYLQWLKWFYRRFFDTPYFWFFSNTDSKILYNFFFEIYLILVSFFNIHTFYYKFELAVYKSLVLWSTNSLFSWKFI